MANVERWLQKTAYAQFEFQMNLDASREEMREQREERQRELETQKAENRDIIRGMNQRWGEIANKMGTIVEDIVAPNIPRILREYFPEYATYTVVPIMSTLNISTEHLSALTDRGIYAMAMGDQTMDLLNAEEIRARTD